MIFMCKKRVISLLLIIIITVLMPSCNEKKDAKEKTADKTYFVNSDFDPYRKTTVYDNMDYYGYYDYIDFYNAIEFDGFKPDIDFTKDVDPFYLIDESDGEGGTCKIIDTEGLCRNFYQNYKRAVRKADNYIISDFKNGVCLNKIIFDKKKYKSGEITIDVPSTIDGKKVLKIGGFVNPNKNDEYMDEYYQTGFLSEFPKKYIIKLKIPSTVTDISGSAFDTFYFSENYGGNIIDIEVDPDNRSFSSKNGILYNKTKEWLLRVPLNYNKDYIVPDTVKYIASGVLNNPKYKSLTVGKNVERIYDDVCDCNCKVYVYRNTYAARWFEDKADELKTTIEYIN